MVNWKDGIKNWWLSKTGQALSNADVQANEFNAAEAQKARDFEVQMYEKYNSPRAMMSQYTDAGLNPALMYEGYSPSAPSSNAVADSVNPSAGDASMTDAIQSMLGIISAKQQIDMTRAQIRNLNADAEGKDIDNANKQRMYDIEYSLKDVNISEAQQRIEESKAEVSKVMQDIKESISRVDVNNKTIEIGDSTIELQGSQKQLNEIKSVVEKLNADTIAKMLPYVQRVQEANIKLTEAQTAAAERSAEKFMYEANVEMLKGMAEAELISQDYYTSVARALRAETGVKIASAVVDGTCKVVGTAADIVFTSAGRGAKSLLKGTKTTTTGAKGTTTTETTYNYE